MKEQATKRPGAGRDVAWLEVGKLWAEVTIPTGRIQAVADQLEEVVTAEIRIRYRKDVVAGIRIVHSHRTYLIEASLPDNDQTMLRLLCSSVTNP